MPIKLLNIIIFSAFCALHVSSSNAGQNHGGHVGGGGGYSGGGCPKGSVKSMKPEALAELEPGATFTAMVFGARSADDIEITVKEIPVEFTYKDRQDFFAITAKLPPELHTTAARVNFKINGKQPNCDTLVGWLYKIK